MHGKTNFISRRIREIEKCARLLEMSGALRRLPRLADKLAMFEKRLQACSIDRVLARGFAVVKDSEGRLVSDSKNLRSGDGISVKMRDGEISARVE